VGSWLAPCIITKQHYCLNNIVLEVFVCWWAAASFGPQVAGPRVWAGFSELLLASVTMVVLVWAFSMLAWCLNAVGCLSAHMAGNTSLHVLKWEQEGGASRASDVLVLVDHCVYAVCALLLSCGHARHQRLHHDSRSRGRRSTWRACWPDPLCFPLSPLCSGAGCGTLFVGRPCGLGVDQGV
jgi:hypothetical protein